MRLEMDFNESQKIVLNIIQNNLPDCPEPYEEIARQSGMTENEVIAFIQSLKNRKIIRRFGASIKHHKAGFCANAMVAWIAAENQLESLKSFIIDCQAISHAYYRPSPASDWPYSFYTMIHGRKFSDCMNVIEKLVSVWPLKEYIILQTKRERKKISPTYF